MTDSASSSVLEPQNQPRLAVNSSTPRSLLTDTSLSQMALTAHKIYAEKPQQTQTHYNKLPKKIHAFEKKKKKVRAFSICFHFRKNTHRVTMKKLITFLLFF